MSSFLKLILFSGCILFLSGCKETCQDGILNQDETFVDCGGVCEICETCVDGIQNQTEFGIDCGGTCPPCISCFDGIQNQDETGIDCGGSCPECETCFDGILNQNETETDCGGICLPCVILCPAENPNSIFGNIAWSGDYTQLPIISHSHELLSNGILFRLEYADGSQIEFYHDFSLFEEGNHASSPLSSILLTDPMGTEYLSFNVDSNVFLFVQEVSSDADCRFISLNFSGSLNNSNSEMFAFANLSLQSYRY